MIGVIHREHPVPQADVVSVESESVSRDRNSIRVGDLVGGEWGADARDWTRDRQWEGGVEQPVDGHGALEGGVQTSMSTRPPRGPWTWGVTYSAWRQLRLGCGVVAGYGGVVLSRGCSLLPSLSSLLAACRAGRGVLWSPTPSIAVHITGASRSDLGSDSDLSSDFPPASDTVTCPFSRGERWCPMSASRSACVTSHAYVRGDVQPLNGCSL